MPPCGCQIGTRRSSKRSNVYGSRLVAEFLLGGNTGNMFARQLSEASPWLRFLGWQRMTLFSTECARVLWQGRTILRRQGTKWRGSHPLENGPSAGRGGAPTYPIPAAASLTPVPDVVTAIPCSGRYHDSWCSHLDRARQFADRRPSHHRFLQRPAFSRFHPARI